MRIVLTDKPLDVSALPEDVRVIPANLKTLGEHAGSGDVAAIVGSRALAARSARLSFPGLLLFQLTSAGFDGVPCGDFAARGVPVNRHVCQAAAVGKGIFADAYNTTRNRDGG